MRIAELVIISLLVCILFMLRMQGYRIVAAISTATLHYDITVQPGANIVLRGK